MHRFMQLTLLAPVCLLMACGTSGAGAAQADPTRAVATLPGAVWLESLDLTKMSKRGRWATHAGKSTGQSDTRTCQGNK